MMDGVTISGPREAGDEGILTDAALAFVADLQRTFGARREALLARRRERQARFDAGEKPDFLPETRAIREGDWTVAPLPADLMDRRVEITGPVDRKMVINALNSGANVFMADFEDSNAPTWRNVVEGQINLRDAVTRTIEYTAPETGKHYALSADPATLLVRPRGWHLLEKHVKIDGAPISASLFDFGLYVFHNAKALLERGTGPYFYLPKLESHLEAQLWNDVFVRAQSHLGLPLGTIKATVLIETLPAAFEMDEILFALRDHSAGLNCGRWDYIFSYIKTLREDADRVLPDRSEVGMTQPFMRAYTQRVIQTCHKRNVHAMGGMAAQIPIKSDPAANEAALAKVRADKEREVKDGHDGTWVAHPGLVAVAKDIFDAHLKGPNQIDNKRLDVKVTAAELVAPVKGARTLEGLRHNLRVGVQYMAAWLAGNGCVPLYHLMEDAATAEISRAQVWQWVHHRAPLDDGQTVTPALVKATLDDEVAALRKAGAAEANPEAFDQAVALFAQLTTEDTLTDFLTLPAYEHLLTPVAG